MILIFHSLNAQHAVAIIMLLVSIVCLNSVHLRIMILMLMSVALVTLALSLRKINVFLIIVLSSLLLIRHSQNAKSVGWGIVFRLDFALLITVQLIPLVPSNVNNASLDSISFNRYALLQIAWIMMNLESVWNANKGSNCWKTKPVLDITA